MSEFTRQDLISDDALTAPGILTEEFSKLVEKLDEGVKKSQEFAKVFSDMNSSTTQLKTSTAGLTTEQQLMVQTSDQITKLVAKQSEDYLEQARVIKDLNQQYKEKIALGDKDAQSVSRQNSSINQIKAALDSNRIAWANLRTEQERQSAVGQKLLKTIQEQDKAFKDLSGSMGQHQAKVGDYKNELMGLFDKAGEGGSKLKETFAVLGETAESSFGLVGAAIGAAAFSITQYFERTTEGTEQAEIALSLYRLRWEQFKNLAAGAVIATGLNKMIPGLGGGESGDRENAISKERIELLEKEIDAIQRNSVARNKAATLNVEARESNQFSIEERLTKAVEANKLLDEQNAETIKLQRERLFLDTREKELFKGVFGPTPEERKALSERKAAIDDLDTEYKNSSRRRISYINELIKALDEQQKKEQEAAFKRYAESSFAAGQLREGKSASSADEQKRISQIVNGGTREAYLSELQFRSNLDQQFAKTMEQAAESRKKEKEEKDREDAERKKRMSEKEIELAHSTAAGVIDAVNAQYTYMQEREAHHLALVTDQYHSEMAIAGDNTQAKIQLTNQYNVERKKSEHEISELRRKQAQFDRDVALIEIAINTSRAIMKDLGDLGSAAAAPFIAIDAAIGAAQAAAVLAKPLPPVYAEGTKDHPGGAAIVGDAGAELLRMPFGAMKLVTEPTLLENAPSGMEVFNNSQTMRMLGMSDKHGWRTNNTQLLHEIKLLRQETAKNRPVNKSVIRDGGVLYEGMKQSDTYFKKVRARNMGKWIA